MRDTKNGIQYTFDSFAVTKTVTRSISDSATVLLVLSLKTLRLYRRLFISVLPAGCSDRW